MSIERSTPFTETTDDRGDLADPRDRRGRRLGDVSLEAHADAGAGATRIDRGVVEDAPVTVLEVDDQFLPDRPHCAGAHRQHRLRRGSREIRSERHVLRQGARGIHAAQLKRDVLLDARDPAAGKYVRLDARGSGEEVAQAGDAERYRLLDGVRDGGRLQRAKRERDLGRAGADVARRGVADHAALDEQLQAVGERGAQLGAKRLAGDVAERRLRDRFHVALARRVRRRRRQLRVGGACERHPRNDQRDCTLRLPERHSTLSTTSQIALVTILSRAAMYTYFKPSTAFSGGGYHCAAVG